MLFFNEEFLKDNAERMFVAKFQLQIAYCSSG